MIDDSRVGAALGLRALAGVVDDERVEQRHVFKRHLRVAGVGEPDALAGQPLHGAVFANVDHGVGLENVPDPPVIGNVMMCRRQIRAVIDSDWIFPEATGRLEAHKNVAQVDPGDGQAIAGSVDLSRRLSPRLGQLVFDL